MSEEIVENVSWNPMLEDYFRKVGEECQAYAWLYTKAEEIYSKRRTWIDIPSNVLAAVVGFISVGSSSLFSGETQLASVALGVASLIVSIMNTTKSYFSWDKKAEGCKISAYHYGKLHRLIMIEMGLPQAERIRCGDFLKMVRDSFEDLNKTSYQLPPECIDAFKKKFNKPEYESIAKPTLVNGLVSIKIFKEEVVKIKTPVSLNSVETRA